MKNAFRPKLRRVLALVLALLLTTALFGCQKKDDSGKTDGSEPPAQSDTVAVPTTTAPVETTEVPTTAPVETTQPEQELHSASVLLESHPEAKGQGWMSFCLLPFPKASAFHWKNHFQASETEKDGS